MNQDCTESARLFNQNTSFNHQLEHMGSIQKSYITILDLDPINTGAKFMKKHFVHVGHVKVLLTKTNAISCLSPYMKRKTVEEFDQNQRKLFDDFSDPLPTLRFCDEI